MSVGDTIHEFACRQSFEMLSDENKLATIEFARGLNDGEYDDAFGLQDFPKICGEVWGGRYDLDQAWSVFRVFGLIAEGKLDMFGIRLPRGPHADRERAKNQAVLSGIRGVETHVAEGHGDRDGSVMLTTEQPALRYYPEQREWREVVVGADVSYPLEIGTTKPSRSALHLLTEFAVARWPYGHKMLHCWRYTPEAQREALDAMPRLDIPGITD